MQSRLFLLQADIEEPGKQTDRGQADDCSSRFILRKFTFIGIAQENSNIAVGGETVVQEEAKQEFFLKIILSHDLAKHLASILRTCNNR
jgi:hypothetical protein